ncbi:MAG: sigma-70 family RNA polymerase sigma factor [Planctomycetota bacterium]
MDYDVSLTTTNVPPTALLSHTDWIRTLSRHLVRDAAAADDLTQETLLAALRGEPRNPTRLRPWLAGIARNLARQESRKTRLRSDREADRALESLGETGEQEAASHAKTLARAEAHRTLVEHVLEMPEPSRSLLLQRYFEDRRPAEIAATEGISPAAVHAKLTRAHGALRKKLEQTGGKEEWLATVGFLLLPEAGKKAATGASTAASAGSVSAAATAGEASTVGAKLLTLAAYGAGALVLLITAGFTAFLLRGNPALESGGSPDLSSRASDPRAPRFQELARVESAQTEAPRTTAPASATTPPVETSAAPSAERPEAPSPQAAEEADAPPIFIEAVDISGQCVDENGRPLTNVELVLVRAIDGRPEYWNGSSRGRVQDRVWTDSDGRFAFTGVPRGLYVSGLAPGDERETSWLTPFDLSTLRGSELADLRIEVPAAHWIEGRLDLSSSTGSGRMQLTAYRGDLAAQAQTTAAIDGRFRFGPLHMGSHTVTSITEAPASIAIPPTRVEAVESIEGTDHLVTIAAAPYVRSLSGTVSFERRDRDEPKAGRVLIGSAAPNDAGQEDAAHWIADASVGSDGSYAVHGVVDGQYFVKYESESGHRVAYELIKLHDEDPSIPDVDLSFEQFRTALQQLDFLQEAAVAQPALTAWVHARRRLKGKDGRIAVNLELKALSKLAPEAEEFKISYPLSPQGIARIVVPLKTKLELKDERGRYRRGWNTGHRKAGEVVTFD